jgi:S-adenosylmethionine uptake transporter
VNRPVFDAILGIALLSAMDAVIKGLVVRLPVVEVAFARYVVGSCVMLVVWAVLRPPLPSRESLRANGARAVIVVVTAVSFFYALGALPLAEALILSFVSPLFTALFATWLLGERLDARIGLALAAGFGGVAIVVWGGLGLNFTGSLLGVAAVLVSAVGYAASNVLLRARAQRDPLVTIVLIQNAAPALILLGPALVLSVVPSTGDALRLVAIGCLGVGGHLFLARAYARAEAARMAVLDYTALIWAVLFGFFGFGEIPTIAGFVGAALILGAAMLSSRR